MPATTIRLLARAGSAAFVNVRHQPKPAVGDEVILSQPVFSAARPAQQAGHGWVTVTLVGGQVSQYHATLTVSNEDMRCSGNAFRGAAVAAAMTAAATAAGCTGGTPASRPASAAAAGNRYAAERLAHLLTERGDLDEAAQVLRTWADTGADGAVWQLAALLTERGDLDGLAAWADAGDPTRAGAMRLAALLAERGDLSRLRGRAEAGDRYSADLLWMETSKPDLDVAREFAEGIKRVYPDQMLAFNCSPSFNWRAHLDESTIAKFSKELAAMGYQFQFITLAGFHALNHSMFKLASGFAAEAMPAYVRLQEAEFAAGNRYAASGWPTCWPERGDLDEGKGIGAVEVPGADRRFSQDCQGLRWARPLRSGRPRTPGRIMNVITVRYHFLRSSSFIPLTRTPVHPLSWLHVFDPAACIGVHRRTPTQRSGSSGAARLAYRPTGVRATQRDLGKRRVMPAGPPAEMPPGRAAKP